MTSFKEQAKAYEPKTTLNIADLERFDISSTMDERTGTGQDGKDFSYKVAILNGIEYRVPNTVLEETKKLLAVKDDIKFIKVNKNGSGLATKYSVSVLE
jgi:hypothetical protein